jgi:glycosyltransferase involved in cell wall biosynthesis
MVFDIPAVSGGALTILEYYYGKLSRDAGNQYILVISKPELHDTGNIKVLRFPWAKRSWLHRLYFDHFIAPRLIRKYNVDDVLSLQNTTIPHTRVSQTLYVHNPYPFSEFKVTVSEDTVLWIYQNIYRRFLIKSIRNANRVIVQTEWMKELCRKAVDITEDKIAISRIAFDYAIEKRYNPATCAVTTFFYPASGIYTKNHKLIVQASLCLKMDNIDSYRVVFTLCGNENRHIRKLNRIIQTQHLPIQFTGYMDRKNVLEYLTKSILIFPSYIESLGLPLEEAKLFGSPILASDCGFSHEILDEYGNVRFFNPFDTEELYCMMKESILSVDSR